MKNKKMVIIISVVVVIALGLFYYFMFNDKNVKLSVHKAGNFTRYNGELPKFSIAARGTVNAEVTKAVLEANNVYPYKFDAYVETNWGVYKNTYIGYKMKDFLSIFKDQNYKSISVANSYGTNVDYPKDKLDNMYIVFYRDDKEINKGKISVISVSENAKYFIDNVVKISINDVEVK